MTTELTKKTEITKCQHRNCSVEFGRLTTKLTCVCCKKVFCDDHACKYTLVEHFLGNHLLNIEETHDKKGYICQSCFAGDGLDISLYKKAFFERKCAHPRCTKSVDPLFSSLNACVTCGNLFCSDHAKYSKLEMSSDWQDKYVNYPEAGKVCLHCIQTKPANVEEKVFRSHPKTSLLKLMAGAPDGKRTAIVVHGIMSHYKNMANFCDALYAKGIFDTIWCLNDYSYQGRVTEAATFSVKDIASLNIPKAVLGKVLAVTDLPAYIIEGAAQTLHFLITQLEMKNITLIGHSLGGLVVRCTSESYDLTNHIDNVITLASPHTLWLERYGSTLKKWKPAPNRKIKYLALLGKGDMVAATTYLANLTASDKNFENVYKILLKGNHTNIHDRPHGKYIPELIGGFLDGFKGFYVIHNQQDEKNYLRYVRLHSDTAIGKVNVMSGEWMMFTAGQA